LHPGDVAQKITQTVRRTNDCRLDNLQCNPPGLSSSFAANLEYTMRFHHSTSTAPGHPAPLCKGRMSSAVCVEVVILAAPSAIQFVRRRYLQDVHTDDLQVSE
jgi:hypothetical protein